MSQLRKLGNLTAIAVLSLLLAACGIGGDDGDDPTETAEQVQQDIDPTATAGPSTPDAPFELVTPTTSAGASTPGNLDPTGPSPTIVEDEGTPLPATPVSNQADGTEPADSVPASSSDTTDDVTDDATPAAGNDEVAGTPSVAPNVGTGSDGTSGATSLPDDAATPGGDVDAPSESTVNAIEVDSCDVVEVPPYAGTTTAFVTADDVNFRIGPGSDCASVLDGPLGPDVAVEVVGGPVVRSDDADNILWLQVNVADDTGWIAQEFLEAEDPE